MEANRQMLVDSLLIYEVLSYEFTNNYVHSLGIVWFIVSQGYAHGEEFTGSHKSLSSNPGEGFYNNLLLGCVTSLVCTHTN